MSDGLSPAAANAQLNVFTGTAPTTYSTVYLALHVGAPGAAGTANPSAGSTTRQSVSFGAAVNASNLSTVTASGTPSWTNTGNATESLTDLSVWSAPTGGVFLFSAPLSASQAWSNNNTVQLSGLTLSYPTAS